MTDRLSVRVDSGNRNHHLWNNNGTWFLHYTVHRADHTKQRVRYSLRTHRLSMARRLRDRVLGGTIAAAEVIP